MRLTAPVGGPWNGMSPKTPQRPFRSLLLLVALAAVVFCAALSIGSSGIGVRSSVDLNTEVYSERG